MDPLVLVFGLGVGILIGLLCRAGAPDPQAEAVPA